MPQTSTAPTPSYITLPKQAGSPRLLDFLDERFPHVGRSVWQARLESGKISDETGAVVTPETPYRINARLCYYREVAKEYPIPFREEIIHRDDEILIVDKPHFLPVTPSGSYVNECLLHRLRRRTGLHELVPVHRLDRETAGLVLFSIEKHHRHQWFDLFRHGRIDKRYEAIASLPDSPEQERWEIESRIERGEPWLRFANVQGEVNARSRIRLLEQNNDLGRFELIPVTGKTHQLRLHMGLIGSQILGDRFYPDFQPPTLPPCYDNPLQLLAKTLSFAHPESGEPMHFTSRHRLDWPTTGELTLEAPETSGKGMQ